MGDIPSMGGRQIGPFLQRAAAAVPDGMAIVEVGTWLGAGTAELARGVQGRNPVPALHGYDLFTASALEVRRAGAEGITLAVGQDTRPVVEALLAPLGVPVTLHRGNVLDATWQGGEIGLYVDDAAKTPSAFFCALDTFAPCWFPGRTTVVLMDYTFYKRLDSARARRRHRVQEDFVTRHADCFERLDVPEFEGMSCAAFRYVKALPMGRVRWWARTARLLQKRKAG
jgi:hypothetical protein